MIGTLSIHSIFCQLSKLWRSLYINSNVKSFLALIVAKVKWQTAKASLVGFALTQIQMFLSNNSPKRSKWRLVKHRPITKNQANIFQSRVQRHLPPSMADYYTFNPLSLFWLVESVQWNYAITCFTFSSISRHWELFLQNLSRKQFLQWWWVSNSRLDIREV